jgi:hypothetical protein
MSDKGVRALDEIESMRQQLAKNKDKASELGSNAKSWQNECYKLQVQFAESQAREKMRIDILDSVGPHDTAYTLNAAIAKAQMVPFDSTALDSAISQAKREALLGIASILNTAMLNGMEVDPVAYINRVAEGMR